MDLLKQISTPEGITVCVVFILLVVSFILMSKFRLLIQKLILQSETGRLMADKAYKAVVKTQDSDLDERMVAVIAYVITKLPIIRLLPAHWVVTALNWYVQKIFDQVKDLLHLYKE